MKTNGGGKAAPQHREHEPDSGVSKPDCISALMVTISVRSSGVRPPYSTANDSASLSLHYSSISVYVQLLLRVMP